MNLEQAKSRRLAALEQRNADKLLVSPAHHAAEMCLPDEGTVASVIVSALSKGLTAEQFATEAGWSRSRTMVNLFKVAKKTGVGIERRDGSLFAVWPDGYEDGDELLQESFECRHNANSDYFQVA